MTKSSSSMCRFFADTFFFNFNVLQSLNLMVNLLIILDKRVLILIGMTKLTLSEANLESK